MLNITTQFKLFSICLVAILFLACSQIPTSSDSEPIVGFKKAHWGSLSPSGYQIVLATEDLAVGTNRFVFGIVNKDGFIPNEFVTLFSSFYPSSQAEPQIKDVVTAKFYSWPYGTKGSYVTELDFDKPGKWKIDVSVENDKYELENVQLIFDVNAVSSSPNIGVKSYESMNKIINNVESIDQLTSGSIKDRELYEINIKDALAGNKPIVVVFASPGFCINPVCGPQVEVLQKLKNKYKSQAYFIHVEFYDNPHEMQFDIKKPRVSPIVLEWNLPSIEWTFVIDDSGYIAGKFEAFTNIQEIESLLVTLF